MKLHELSPAPGSVKESYRKGRGPGSGNGKTAGKGHKGQNARSGGGVRTGFEGGQMPIYRILPKRGFKNINRVEYNAINISTLQMLAEKNITDINRDVLVANGLAKKNSLIAILAKGELTAKVNVTADKYSAKAKAAIEQAGGVAALVNAPAAE